MSEQPSVGLEFQGSQERGEQVGREVGAEVLRAGYDHLFDPTHELPEDTRAAAVPPAQTSHRAGYWNKPTPAQVENAAKFGFDLTKQDKY